MKEYIRKHPKDSVLNAWTGETGAYQNTPSQSAPPMTKEEWEEEKERIRKNASIANIGSIGSAVPQRLVAGYNETTGEKVLNRIEQQEEDREFEKELFGGWTLVGVFVIAMLVCAFFWGLFFLGVLKVMK